MMTNTKTPSIWIAVAPVAGMTVALTSHQCLPTYRLSTCGGVVASSESRAELLAFAAEHGLEIETRPARKPSTTRRRSGRGIDAAAWFASSSFGGAR